MVLTACLYHLALFFICVGLGRVVQMCPPTCECPDAGIPLYPPPEFVGQLLSLNLELTTLARLAGH